MKSPPSKKKTNATQSSEVPPKHVYIPGSEVNEYNYRDITVGDVVGAIAYVKFSFDDGQAQNLIRYFHYMLKDGNLFSNVQLSPVEREFVTYVEHGFARIVNGKSADVAFGLKLGRGQYHRQYDGSKTLDRDICVAAYVILQMRKDWPREAAIGVTENFFRIGRTAIREAYDEFKSAFSHIDDETLLKLLPQEIPAITQYAK